jgi:ribose transport system substrate-binding protein
MKRLLFFFTILSLLLVLVGCASNNNANKPFVLLSVNRSHPVVRVITLGFFEACRDLKVECKNYSSEGVDFTLYAAAVDQVVAAGSQGAIAFVDKAVYAQDKKLIDAKIPIDMIHGIPLPDAPPGIIAWVATDAADYAKRAADFMGGKMAGKGVVAISQGNLNDLENMVSDEFTKEMKAKYPAIKVLTPEMEGFDAPAAIAKISSVITAHPEITAAFGTTGGSASAWAKALEQSGRKPGSTIVVGMDYTRENLDLVKAGKVTALIGQPLYEETYKALEILVANSKGQKINYANPLPAPIITVDNLATYYGYADRVDQLIEK